MDEMTTRVTIEPAQNGYMVYLNDFPTGISARKVPYVFENMENLLEFIKTKLS